MSINEYKNISDNPCIMSDTDNVILPIFPNLEYFIKIINSILD